MPLRAYIWHTKPHKKQVRIHPKITSRDLSFNKFHITRTAKPELQPKPTAGMKAAVLDGLQATRLGPCGSCCSYTYKADKGGSSQASLSGVVLPATTRKQMPSGRRRCGNTETMQSSTFTYSARCTNLLSPNTAVQTASYKQVTI